MIKQNLTASVVVGRALGLLPVGLPIKSRSVCAFCGLRLSPGDQAVSLSLEDCFMDDIYMAARGSSLLCVWCQGLKSPEGRKVSQRGVFSEEGVRPFSTWADIAESLANPPNKPFVMLYGTLKTMNMHMAWRAPVNYSKDLFYVRMGLRDLKIRRSRLLDAVWQCQRLGIAVDELQARSVNKQGKSSAKKTLPNPFLNLSSDLKDPDHGAIRSGVFQLREEQHVKDLEQVMQLTLGETWALKFLLTPGAGKSR